MANSQGIAALRKIFNTGTHQIKEKSTNSK
jgi:hypothetical protein